MTVSRRFSPRLLPALPCLLALALPVQAANVRFIVFSSSLNAGDLAMRNLMQSFGHTVTVKSAPSSSAADTTGQDLVVISSSVGTVEVNTKFRNVAKPVITLKYGLFDEMGMVSTAAYQAGGFAGGQTAILAPTHHLAAGFTGTVQVFSPDDNLNWGLPAAGALRIASLQGDPNRVTLFAYESGAAMAGMNAPARRLAFFYRDNGAVRTTAQGQTLFQAAINWCLGLDGPPPAAPAITAQPANASVVSPQTATFTVAVSGNPTPTLQWYRNGAAIPGATGASYTTAATSPADNGSQFHAVATNNLGAVGSGSAVLDVGYAPVITDHPDAITIVDGAEAVFSAAAHANPPINSWQWLMNGGDIPDSDSDPAVLRTPPLPAAFDGALITLVVTNAHGSTTSQGALVSILSPPAIEAGPDPLAVNAGDPAFFSVLATGNPAPAYQWRRNGVAIPGALSADLLVAAATASDDGAVYSVTATNAAGSAEASAILTVRSAPVIVIQPQGATVSEGSGAVLSVSAQGTDPLAYQWRKNGADIPGATSASYSLAPATYLDDSTRYAVRISNTAGSVLSQEALLRVLYRPFYAYPHFAGLTGGAGNIFTFEVLALGNPVPTYQWTSTNPAFSGPDASGRRVRAPVPAGPVGSVHVYNFVASNSQGGRSQSMAVTNNGPAAFRILPAASAVTAGQSLVLSAQSVPTSMSLQWERNGQAVPGATAASLSIVGASASDAGTYRLVASHDAFHYSIASDSAMVEFHTPPVFAPMQDTVYSYAGEPVTFQALVTGNPAPTFQWRRDGVDIPGATGATHTTGPLGHEDDSARYSVRATNAAGTATSADIFLSVRYAPHILTQPASASVAAGQPHTFTVSVKANPPLPPANFGWRRNGTLIPGAVGTSYTLPAVSLADQGAAFSVVITNHVGTATSEDAILTVLTPPEVLSGPEPLTVAAGATATFTVIAQANPPVTGYQWQRNGVDIAGATSATYSLITGSGDDSSFYRVAVTNAVGTTFSEAALLRVEFAPILLTIPSQNRTGLAGDSVTFEVRLLANPAPTYVFTAHSTNSPTPAFTPPQVDGQKEFTLRSPVPPGPVMGYYSYVVTISNSQGWTSSTLSAICIGVPFGAPWIWQQPRGDTVDAGQAAIFDVRAEAYPIPFTYQWFRNGQPIPGATIPTYSIPATTPSDDGAVFTAVVSNSEGSVTSQAAVLTVLSPPAITSQPPPEYSTHAGQGIMLQVGATGNPAPTYQWSRNGVPIPGATSATYGSPPLLLADDQAVFAVTVSNALGSVTSAATLVSVLPPLAPPAIVADPEDLFLYPGEVAVFRIGVTGNPMPTVTWSFAGPGFEPGQHIGDSLWLGPVELSDNGTQVQASVQNQYGHVMSRTAILRVSQRPTRHLVSLTGELFDSGNLSPIGYDHVAGADVIVRLYPEAEGGTAVYTEEFLRAEGRSVAVDRGLFTVRLGQGRSSQALSEVIAGLSNLHAELTVEVEGLPRETIQPRTPITSPLLAGTPRILQGTVDPTASEPAGTYYENTAAGSTWLRMPTAWIRIAP